MKLTFLGESSGKSGCPRLYATDRDTFVVQGWKLLDAEALAGLDVPDHETVVEIPLGLLDFAVKGA